MIDLRHLRKERGLTGMDVCRAIGFSTSTLSLIENGKRRPSVDLAKRIASFVGFDWTLFFADDKQIMKTATDVQQL